MAVDALLKFIPRGLGPGLRFLTLFGLSIVILVIDHRDDRLDPVRRTLSAVVHPLRVTVSAPGSIWRWASEGMTDRETLQVDNARLHAERLLTNARLQRYAALEAENARLRAMLEATGRVTDRVRVAELVSVNANPYRHSIVIDKGTRAGAYDGQSMIDSNGVVGQVVETGPFTSQCVLISDPDHALPVEINRNGLRTIAVGTGAYDRLDLPFLPNNADVREGDLLITSGLGGAFPAGYPVAVVTEVTRIPAEPFASVAAEPAAELNQVREVMLVWSNREEPQEDSTDAEAESTDEPNAESAMTEGDSAIEPPDSGEDGNGE